MKWKENYTVNSFDTDYKGNMRPSAILRYYTETALRHINGCHPSDRELRDTGRAFVVCRTACDYLVPIKENDDITVYTWAANSMGFSFERKCTFYRGDELCVKISSQWALLDFVNMKMCRVTDEFTNYGSDEDMTVSFPLNLRIPKNVTLEKIATHKVGYSDADVNVHMNNALYLDTLMNCIDADELNDRRVDKFFISYLKEAHLGSSFDVYGAIDEEGKYLFRTVKDDTSTGIEAVIHLS